MSCPGMDEEKMRRAILSSIEGTRVQSGTYSSTSYVVKRKKEEVRCNEKYSNV